MSLSFELIPSLSVTKTASAILSSVTASSAIFTVETAPYCNPEAPVAFTLRTPFVEVRPVPATSPANLAAVTASSASFAVVIFASAILAVVTLASKTFAVVTASSAIFAVVI